MRAAAVLIWSKMYLSRLIKVETEPKLEGFFTLRVYLLWSQSVGEFGCNIF